MRFIVDFQSVRAGDRITVSLKYEIGGGAGIPQPGDDVILDDTEGHTARATVTKVEGSMVKAVIDWSSWRDVADSAGFESHFDPELVYRGHRSRDDEAVTRKQGTSAVHAGRIFVGVGS